MEKTILTINSVASVKKPARIEIAGFEQADESIHMIEWLRKGKDFRGFIVHDIESELYAQDQGSQLLSVKCKTKPEYETKIRRENDRASKAIVTQLSVTFPVSLRVKAANDVVWELDVQHNYHATNLDIPDQFNLQLNFTVVRAQQI